MKERNRGLLRGDRTGRAEAAGLAEWFYLAALLIYLLCSLTKRVAWTVEASAFERQIQEVFRRLSLGTAWVAMAAEMLRSVKNRLYAVPVLALAACGMAAMDPSLSALAAPAPVFFILYSCGKHFRKICKVYLAASASVLVIGALGMWLGFTYEKTKVGAYGTGFAFGTSHANTWGFLAILVALLCWYLYLRQRMMITWGLFWALGVFLILVPKCRTGALLAFGFPVIYALICRGADEKRGVRRPYGAGVFASAPVWWFIFSGFVVSWS
ncbi:MAG: hypothetical protein IJM26_01315 [Lachnospiraceae bacterium]|nr:hypothetical protein [Lachnospiraceae bacterium]